MKKCLLCSDNNAGPDHSNSAKHLKNKALHGFSLNRGQCTNNRKGVVVKCNVKSSCSAIEDCLDAKIKISAKPNETIKFIFSALNDSTQSDLFVKFVQMPEMNSFNFKINNHGMAFGDEPVCLKPKNKLQKEIAVDFKSPHIGQYEMPIFFSFEIKESNEIVVITRDMVVYVEEIQSEHLTKYSPFTNMRVYAKRIIPSNKRRESDCVFGIPKNYKILYANALNIKDSSPHIKLKDLAKELSAIIDSGPNKENYVAYFHNLLWYEETIVRINLKNYNMTGVEFTAIQKGVYSLIVPGLAEKRPSLLLGDSLYVKNQHDEETMFEAVIWKIEHNSILIKGLNNKFNSKYSAAQRFDIRFVLSRTPFERMHVAVHSAIEDGHQSKVFPVENKNIPKAQTIYDYFNMLVEKNPEQRLAVENILAGTSGAAPFLLHGPPGTGKTVTIAEAILQLVNKDESNRIMVCTDSNMAADHVATVLIQFAHMFDSDGFLLRANSMYRVWEVLPECLYPYSNGSSCDTFEPLTIDDILEYRIIITTLSHAAKFARQFQQAREARPMTHLFIDEAAQASEPACLIPICGLLAPRGSLVLAGDPHQLGPVVISNIARSKGLGLSLMERLMRDVPLYSDEKSDSNYVVMLKNNFRSHADIIELPNELFYKKLLNPCCTVVDDITTKDILDKSLPSRAIIFHGILSQEERMGKSPSFFNTMEAETVQSYIKALVNEHRVKAADIGVITPYIRQVYKIKTWLHGYGLDKIEVGTVESFQGKEKRVIIISTVRANCKMLDHDARFQLGFLVDDKRFNVALTRAKAKAIIIGNPLCLDKDTKWRKYMQRCRELGTYRGFDAKRDQIIDQLTPMLQNLGLEKTVVETKRKANKRA